MRTLSSFRCQLDIGGRALLMSCSGLSRRGLEVRAVKCHVRQNSNWSNILANAMAKTSANKSTPLRAKRRRAASKSSSQLIKPFKRELANGGLVSSRVRFEAVMRAAEQSGLLSEKGSLIGGRGPGPTSQAADRHQDGHGFDPNLRWRRSRSRTNSHRRSRSVDGVEDRRLAGAKRGLVASIVT
jgi:hypothetical protein